MNPKRDLLFLTLAGLVVSVACLPLLLVGAQGGARVISNLIWSSNFANQLIDGEVYPRWLIDPNWGGGSPVFFFYAPAPFYLTAVGAFLCGQCTTAIQLGIGEWLIVLLSSFSFYLFARHYAAPVTAFVGAVIYALAPYHFSIDLLKRQAIGETAAYIWIPLIVWSIDRLATTRYAVVWLALSYCLLVLSHLPSALIFGVFLLLFAATRKYQSASTPIYKFSFGMAAGIALSAVYWIPAMGLQDFISADRWWGSYQQIDRWFFLDGKDAPDKYITKHIFNALLVTSLLFVVSWTIAYRHTYQRQPLHCWLLFFLGSWFLLSPLSYLVWEYVPYLKKVQFPWRVMVVLEFSVAASFVLGMHNVMSTSNRRLFVVLASAVTVLFVLTVHESQGTFRDHWKKRNDESFQATRTYAVARGKDTKEYFPPVVRLHRDEIVERVRARARVRVDHQSGEVSIARWKPRDIVVKVSLSEPAQVVVRQFFFSGWTAKADNWKSLLTVQPDDIGLLKIDAPAGEYQLSLKLEPTWPEILGRLVSGVGVATLIIFVCVGWARARTRW